MYNKRKFLKDASKKVLHKIHKIWVTISLALLALIGGGAVASTTAKANTQKPVNTNTNSNNQQLDSVSSQVNQSNQSLLMNNKPLSNDSSVKATPQDPKIKNLNQLAINQEGRFHGVTYKRVALPTNSIKVTNAKILLHSNPNSTGRIRSYYHSVKKGQILHLSRAFLNEKLDLLRYEVPVSNREVAFITGTGSFVERLPQSHSYRFYVKRIEKILNQSDYGQYTKFDDRFNQLRENGNKNYKEYFKLYNKLYNVQNHLGHKPVKTAKNNSSLNEYAKEVNELVKAIESNPVDTSLPNVDIPNTSNVLSSNNSTSNNENNGKTSDTSSQRNKPAAHSNSSSSTNNQPNKPNKPKNPNKPKKPSQTPTYTIDFKDAKGVVATKTVSSAEANSVATDYSSAAFKNGKTANDYTFAAGKLTWVKGSDGNYTATVTVTDKPKNPNKPNSGTQATAEQNTNLINSASKANSDLQKVVNDYGKDGSNLPSSYDSDINNAKSAFNSLFSMINSLSSKSIVLSRDAQNSLINVNSDLNQLRLLYSVQVNKASSSANKIVSVAKNLYSVKGKYSLAIPFSQGVNAIIGSLGNINNDATLSYFKNDILSRFNTAVKSKQYDSLANKAISDILRNPNLEKVYERFAKDSNEIRYVKELFKDISSKDNANKTKASAIYDLIYHDPNLVADINSLGI